MSTKISHTALRRVKCETCGRRFLRQRTFIRRAEPGTVFVVMAQVQAEAHKWDPPPDCGRHK